MNERNVNPDLQLQLRKAVRGKDTKTAVNVLRELLQSNRQNAEYRKDLVEFEKTRLEQIKPQIVAAMNAGSDNEILTLAKELEGEWQVEIDPGIKRPLLERAEEIRKNRKIAEATRLIEKVSMAYAAGDWKKAKTPIDEVKRYLANTMLLLPSDLEQEWKDDLQWFEDEQKAAQKQSDFEAAVAKLQEALRIGEPKGVETAYRELRVFEKPFSDDLAFQAEQCIANAELQQDRSRKMKVAITALAMVLLIAGGLFFSMQVRMNNRAEEIAESFTQMALPENEDLEGMVALIGRLEDQEPRVFQRPDVQDLFTMTNQVVEIRQAREQSLDRILNEAEAAAVSETLMSLDLESFQTWKIQIDTDLENAEEELVRTAEERARHSEALRAWIAALQKRDSDLQKAFAAWEESATSTLQKLQSLDFEDKKERAQQQAKMEQLLAAVPPVSNETSVTIARDIRKRYEDWSRAQDDEKKQLELIAASETLEDYLLEMETFSKAYPEHALTPLMNQVLEHQDAYRSLIAPLHEIGSGHLFYGDAFRQRASRRLESEKWKEVQDEIASWTDVPEMINIFRISKEGRIGFIMGPLPQGYQAMASNSQVTTRIFVPSSGDTSMFPDFKETEISVFFLRDAKFTAESEAANKVIAEVKFLESTVAYQTLLKETQIFLSDRSLNPVFRLDMGKYLVEQLVKIAPAADEKPLDALREELFAVKNDISWMCLGHPQYKTAHQAAKRKCETGARRLSAMSGTEGLLELNELALDRRPIFMGFQKFGSGELQMLKEPLPGKELWIVRNQNERPRIFIQGVQSEDGPISNIPLQPGEPVFAPPDTLTTRSYLDSFLKNNPDMNMSEIRKNVAWPVNIPE